MPAQSQTEMRVFIPIRKVDEAKRIVYGTLTAEVADKAGEIFDYESGKLAIQKWSESQSKASGGKSLGNLREMHGNIAAGKFTDISFDDEAKVVQGAAYVSDDSTWKKVLDGTLTGFSIGGGYAKRWDDPENPHLKRFTPTVSETSLVDNPCVATATFEVIKANGSIELRKFTSTISAQEAQSKMTQTSTNPADSAPDLEVPAPEQVWKATDGSTHKSKKEALAKNAALLVDSVTAGVTDALAKLEDGVTVREGGEPAAPEGEPVADAPADAPEDSVPAAESADATPESAPDAGQTPEPAAGKEAAVEKAAPAFDLKKSFEGIYDARCAMEALSCIANVLMSEEYESKEGEAGEGSQIADLREACKRIRAFIASEIMEGVEGLEGEELALKLAKAASKTDKAHLAAMADHHGSMSKSLESMGKCLKALGMGDDADAADAGDAGDSAQKMAKAAGLTDEQLTKLEAFDGLSKKFDETTAVIATLTERLAKVESMPAETKGIMNTALVKKSHEGNDGSGASPAEAAMQKMINQGASPEQTAQALMNLALQNPQVLTNN